VRELSQEIQGVITIIPGESLWNVFAVVQDQVRWEVKVDVDTEARVWGASLLDKHLTTLGRFIWRPDLLKWELFQQVLDGFATDLDILQFLPFRHVI
jgi:hypothetical protein